MSKRVVARANGPYILTGPFELVDPTGKSHRIPEGKLVALCRCGNSRTKPYCDASHNTCGFKSADPAPEPPR